MGTHCWEPMDGEPRESPPSMGSLQAPHQWSIGGPGEITWGPPIDQVPWRGSSNGPIGGELGEIPLMGPHEELPEGPMMSFLGGPH